ncbi:MAG TPA: carboxypeptidase-like regulatory domain-containing protein, partial [Dehalococcoidia bacterium]|nr:carboxypeptidase-like regulatory domain-containing protein [Dehalococcoidia bacterium]
MKPARVCFAILLLAASQTAQAQTANTGTVLGLVADPSGAVVPGAEVQLTDATTSAVRTAVANESGRYTFVAVKPGTYSVAASAPGFQKSVVAQLVVEVARSYTVNFELKLGQGSEQVVVTST